MLVDLTHFFKALLWQHMKGRIISYGWKLLGKSTRSAASRFLRRGRATGFSSLSVLSYLRLAITMQSLICTGPLWAAMWLICLSDQIKHIKNRSAATAIKIELIPTFICCKQMVDCFSVLLRCSLVRLDPLFVESDMLVGQFSDKVICLQSMKRTALKVGWAIFRVWSNSMPRFPRCLSLAAPSQVYSCRFSAHTTHEERKVILSYYCSEVIAIH